MKSYNIEEVIKATLPYFKGDQLAADVWARKYCLKDSENYYELTPTDMHWRIAKELARIENKYSNSLSEEEIFKTLDKFERIVPQGSPMSGIGNDLQVVSLSNCFVIGSNTNSDSYGGILKIDQEQVQLMKRRGGVGHDLSHIRPKGSLVKNSALTSTGIVPFMERYSNTTKEVAQDGRRGALMLSVSIKHPDSEDFINAKLEQGKVTNANISVKMHDDFMEAALSNNEYTQQFPINSDNPILSKKINANKLWKKIVYNAWKSAEPGILFWDTIIRESIPDCYADFGYKTVSTNPCFPASEYILTENGYNKFGDLFTKRTDNNVVCDNRISYSDDSIEEKPENWKFNFLNNGTTIRKASNVFLTQEDAKLIEIKTSKGFKLRCTPDHHIATSIGMVEAKDLTPDHNILISIPDNSGSIINKIPESIDEILSGLIGLITGDGTFDKTRKRVHLDFWGDDKDRMKEIVCNLIDILHSKFGDFYNDKNRILSKYFISNNLKNNKIRISSAWLSKLLNNYGFNRETKYNVPEFIMNNSSTNIGKYYLAGLFYCDGSFQGSKVSGYTIRLSQSNEELLRKVQMMLHSNGMLFGLYKRREAKITMLPNGNGSNSEYKTKTQYELISIAGSIVKYRESIGFFGDKIKENNMMVNHNFQVIKSFTDNIIEISELKNESVYCIQEPISRSIIVNGLSTRRCGEIPLCPYDSCRLLCVNLYGYVINPFTKAAYFNWELFKSDVQKSMRYMDDIIDLEQEKIDKIIEKINADPEDEFTKLYEVNLWTKIKEMTISGRRTGLGITAEGDMLASLGLRYGTDPANDFSTEVHKQLKLAAYRSSVELAKERGAFPIYDAKLEANNPFIQRIKEEDLELYNDMVKYGRRNIALLTIAPTGTVSLMTQTTSGIEPVFMPVYKRRRKINTQEKNVRIDFTDDEGVNWAEYPVFHHKFADWLVISEYDLDVVKSMTMAQVDEIVKQSPYYKATSNDVDWVKKVEMQGMIQKHIDHSISVTVNLPENVDVETVAMVYEAGWRHGCKGMTVYRDGSRDGVLITNSEKKEVALTEKFQDTHAPKRPKRLKGEIIRFQNNNEKWIGVVGLLDARPYEIFTGLLANGLSNIPVYVKECEIIKNIIEVDELDPETNTMIKVKKKRYDLEYFDIDGKKQIATGLSHKFNPEYWNYAKLISGILRHGMPLVYTYELIDSLNLNNESLNTWKNGIVRIIKKYIKNGEKVKKACPNCGGEHLEFVEGCLVCKGCGFSGCS